MNRNAIKGCILGTAVGDALGLPYEGISSQRTQKIFTDLGKHHFIFGHGMISDDTEHTCFIAQALIAAQDNPELFAEKLAWSLRWWFLGLPAGIGFATLKSILKLWIGFSPNKSGVFSAGNGPAMRSALLGICYGGNPELLKNFAKRSTRITHTDPKAYYGSLAISIAAYLASTGIEVQFDTYGKILSEHLKGEDAEEFMHLMNQAVDSALQNEAVKVFAKSIGCKNGISGYMYHTVPCVIQTWLRYQNDFKAGLLEILSAGGDTDTTGAILGAIIGAGVGKQGIPSEWIQGILEWPRSVKWMEKLSQQLTKSLLENPSQKPLRLPVPGLLVRNFIFTIIVLVHGLRRLFPPY